MKKVVIIFLILNFNFSWAQNYNRPIEPNVLFPFNFTSHQSLNSGYFLIAPCKTDSKPSQPDFISPKPVILDKNGFVFGYMNDGCTNIKYFPSDSSFGFIKITDQQISYRLMDLNFNIVDSIDNVNNIRPDGHEIQRLSNGNIIIGGTSDTTMDLSTLVYSGKPGSKKTVVRGYVLQEFNKRHELVFQWKSNQYIHPRESYELYPYDSTKYDYAHGNSIEEDIDGNLLVSLRSLNAVYKINHRTGKVIWKLGGRSSDFKFVNDSGFSGQHDVRVLPGGLISLFDNANSAREPKVSRAVQYQLDTNTWTATKTWEYNEGFFVKGMGSYQITKNDNHILNYGHSFRPNPSVSFVDENKKPIARITFKDSIMSYRALFVDIPFKVKQENIQVYKSQDQTLLIAPNGFKKYAWSTGDTTQYIIVNKPETYQVFVNYGDGMIGSLPLKLSNKTKNTIKLYDSKNKMVAVPKKGVTYYLMLVNGGKLAILWK